jgi:hypothetical protein
MANVYAVKTGNWSDTTVWNTGALPTSADDVYTNNFTVTVDISPTVLTVRNSSGAGITAGGTFSLANGVNLTCTNTIGFGQTGCIIFSQTAPSAATLTASSTYTTGNLARFIINNSTGTLNIIGTVSSAGGGGGHHVSNESSGTINITGFITGSSGGGAQGSVVRNISTGIVNFTGSVSLDNSGNGAAFHNTGSGTVNVTGPCTLSGSPTVPPGGILWNESTGTIICVGSITNSALHAAAINSSSGNLTINGTLTATSTAPVVAAGSGGQNTFLTGPFIGTAQGNVAVGAYRWRWIASVGSSYMTIPNSTGTGYKNLYTSDSTLSQSGQPAVGNVRSGTVYGPASELTGTCVVPVPGSVGLGVPVDNTIGTAVLSASAAKEACSKAIVPALLALG